MKEHLTQVPYMAKLAPGERALARVVQLMHKCCSHPEYLYAEGTTHIGNVAEMQCKQCGETWDITDYEVW